MATTAGSSSQQGGLYLQQILTALQNGVVAINGATMTMKTIFPSS